MLTNNTWAMYEEENRMAYIPCSDNFEQGQMESIYDQTYGCLPQQVVNDVTYPNNICCIDDNNGGVGYNQQIDRTN